MWGRGGGGAGGILSGGILWIVIRNGMTPSQHANLFHMAPPHNFFWGDDHPPHPLIPPHTHMVKQLKQV